MADIKQLPALSGNANQKMEQIAGKVRELVPTTNAATNGLADTTATIAALAARLVKLEQAPAKVTTVIVALVDPSLEIGETTTATATAQDALGNTVTGKTVQWSVSNPVVGSVDTTGTITALRDGVSKVYALIDGIRGEANLDVSPLPVPQPTPVPEPEPEPPPTDLLSRLLMSIPSSIADIRAIGPLYQQYADTWLAWAPKRRLADGVAWNMSTYYDRTQNMYALSELTGDTQWRDYGSAVAVDYRDNYLAKIDQQPFNVPTFWAMPAGLALHFAITGDTKSRDAVGNMAGWLCSGYAWTYLATGSGGMENRWRARVLESAVFAHAVGAPAHTGHWVTQVIPIPGATWKERAQNIVAEIKKGQGADGTFRNTVTCGYVQPFMNILLADALILYYNNVEQDPTILTMVQKMLDWDWRNMWLGPNDGFSYLEGRCEWFPGQWEGPGPSDDLTPMFVHGFAWVAKMTGSAEWKERARTIFAAGVTGAYWELSKQYNQAVLSWWRGVEWLK